MRTGAPRRGSVPTEMTEACAVADPRPAAPAEVSAPAPESCLRSRGGGTGWPGTALAGLAFLIAAGISAPILIPRAARESRPAPAPAARPPSPTGPSATVAKVWLVEQTPDSETYSNGLRIERQSRWRAAEAVIARSRARWPTAAAGSGGRSRPGSFFTARRATFCRSNPARTGSSWSTDADCWHMRASVPHTTSSSTGLAGTQRGPGNGQGRPRAGHSIWADAEWIYVNLNASFLAICFEAQTRPGGGFSPAQIHAGKVLVEMLRSAVWDRGRQLRNARAGFRQPAQLLRGVPHRLGHGFSFRRSRGCRTTTNCSPPAYCYSALKPILPM